jgi:hypothetical protein
MKEILKQELPRGLKNKDITILTSIKVTGIETGKVIVDA